MIYNEKTQPINKMAHKMFCNAKTILVLGLILFCSSMIMAQTSPNGYSFEHSWEYYSNFVQTNLGGYTQTDHISIQMNPDGNTVTPDTLCLNSDTVLIRVWIDFYRKIGQGQYTMRFVLKKLVNGTYVDIGEYNQSFVYQRQECIGSNLTIEGNGSFLLSYRLANIKNQTVRSGEHTFEKTNSQHVILSNPNLDTLFKIRSSNSSLKRPMLLVEGYDYRNRNGVEFYNGIITQMENNNEGVFDGVDLYFLNFKDTSIDARENAMVVLGTIKYIYNLYQTETLMEGISVLGFSMGGIVSRYALAYAEHNNIAHHCTQLITYDSPHRGAVINTNLQLTICQLHDEVEDMLSGVSGIFTPVELEVIAIELRSLINSLNSPAIKQLLRYNRNSAEYTNEMNGSIDFRDFYSEINLEERFAYHPNNVVLNYDANDPNSKPGYPYKQNSIRSLAISNGGISRNGDATDSYTRVCKFTIDKPNPFEDKNFHVYKQNCDTQPGSSLGITSWIGDSNQNFTPYFDPVLVPLKSSLHLRPQGTNGYPDNPDLVINVYDDIVPRDSSNNVITDHQEIANYLVNHSLFDSVVFSNVANLRHADISEFVVSNAVSYFKDPFNRAIATISGRFFNTDLNGIVMEVFLGDLEHPLDDSFYKLNSDGSWSVAYTLPRDMDVIVKFSKDDCLPTLKRYHMAYDGITHSVNSIENQFVRMYDFTPFNIVVSKTHSGSFGEISDAVNFLTNYINETTYHGEPIRIGVASGTYSCPVDLSPLVAKGVTNFTLEGMGNSIIKTVGYGIKLVVDTPADPAGNVPMYNIKNIHITADNVPGNNDNMRGIIYMDLPGGPEGSLTDPRITLNIQNCKIYDCCSYRSSETINPVPSAAAIHFEGAGTISDCEIYDNWIRGSDGTDSEHFQAGGLYVNNNTSSLVVINGNTFEHNEGGLAGGVVAKGKGSILIHNNDFSGNTYGSYCDIDGAYDANALSVYEASDIVIKNNIFVENIKSSFPYGPSVGLATYVSQVASPIRFINNTIINTPPHPNSSFSAITFMIYAGTSIQDIHIKNNIVSSTNTNGCMISKSWGHQPVSVNHNVLHNIGPFNYTVHLYDPGDPTSVCCPDSVNFNYSCEPELDDTTYVPTWDETTMSPCIDNGEWLITGRDPDGTPPDIGAKRAVDHGYWEYLFRAGPYDGPNYGSDTYHWVSYPVVNSRNQDRRVARSFFHELLGTHRNDNEVLVADVLQEILWREGNKIRKIEWFGGNWGPYIDTHHVASHQGYKIKLKPLDDNFDIVGLSHSGFLTSDTTPFPIYGSGFKSINSYENWIGYFGTESVWPGDAFESIWDDLTMVKAKDWCLYRDPVSNTNTLEGVMRPINPGDMVVVSTICDHQFSWNTSNPTDPIVKEKPIAFIYDEKADYTPVYVDLSGVDTANLREIGLKHDGVCKGAVVVTDSLEQICAYLEDDESLSSGTVELEFFYESGKSALQDLKSIAINREQLNCSHIGGNPAYPVYNIKLTNSDLSDKVVPVLALEQNYPNPFNPSTTIRYSLDKPGRVSLDIYNIKGQLVKNLYRGDAEAGNHSVIWNGLDNSGKACASGVYFYKLRTSKTSLVQKMLLMK
ncbi:MAG: T9SS type A sorting domain-containing protein [Candidatus Cloacimonadaceae bacterium]|jgi:hypothetical protein